MTNGSIPLDIPLLLAFAIGIQWVLALCLWFVWRQEPSQGFARLMAFAFFCSGAMVLSYGMLRSETPTTRWVGSGCAWLFFAGFCHGMTVGMRALAGKPTTTALRLVGVVAPALAAGLALIQFEVRVLLILVVAYTAVLGIASIHWMRHGNTAERLVGPITLLLALNQLQWVWSGESALQAQFYLGSVLRVALACAITIAALGRASRTARESEARFRALFDAVPQAMTVARLDNGVIVQVNPAFERASGLRSETVVGRPVTAVGIWARPEEREQMVATLRQQGRIDGFEHDALVHGELRRAVVSAVVIELDGAAHTLSMTQDITEQRRQELALRHSGAMHKALLHAMPEYMTISRLDNGQLLEVSHGFEDMTGWSREEALGRTSLELGILTPEDRKRWAMALRDSGGQLRGLDIQMRRKDGRFIEAVASLAIYEVDGLQYLASVATDVTEARRREALLNDSQSRWALMFAALPDYACISRLSDGLIIDVNPAFERVTGWTREDAVGRTSLELGIWNDAKDRERYRAAIQAQSYVHDYEAVLTSRNGEQRIMVASAAIVRASDGDLLITVSRDATEERQREAQLRDSQARWALMFAALPNYACITRLADGQIIDVNPAFERVTGWSREAAVGCTTLKLGIWSDPKERERYVAMLRAQSMVHDFEAILTTRFGDKRIMITSAAIVRASDGDFLISVARDATEERQRDAALRDSQARAARMFTALPNFACITRVADGRIMDVNPSFERISGWSRDEAVGRTTQELGFWTHGGNRAQFVALLREHSAVHNFEVAMTTRSGDIRTLLLSAALVSASDGDFVITMAIDTTDERQREAELRATQAAKQAAEVANQLKSDFLAMISHEVRTPLGGVIGMLRFALKDTRLSTGTREKLAIGLSNAETLLQIINDILDFSKLQAGKMPLECVDFRLATVVRDAVTILEERAESKGLSLVAEVDAQLPAWWQGDPTRLRQVLINLMGNAIKFTEHGEVRLTVGAHATGGLEFAVRDTGIGIAPEALARLFRKFEQADASTTRRFGGTGLGLAICKTIVEGMGGDIAVASAPGQGTTFTVSLPLAQGQAVRETVRDGTQPHGRALRVLCAEDGVTNQVILRELVTGMGHHFSLAEDGEAAMDALAQADFDLLILDSRMPRLDGIDVLHSLRAGERGVRNPALPVIACTANAGADERARFLAAGAQGFVSKPIDEDALHTAITDAIAALDGDGPVPHSTAPTPSAPTGGAMAATAAMRLAFVSEGPRLVATLRAALTQGDAPAAARAAHGLKGSAGYFGAAELQTLAHGAEQSANAGRIDAAADTLDAIAAAMDALVNQLRALSATPETGVPTPVHAATATADLAVLQTPLATLDALLSRQSLDAEAALEQLRARLPTGSAQAAATQIAEHLAGFDFAAAKTAMAALRHALETPP